MTLWNIEATEYHFPPLQLYPEAAVNLSWNTTQAAILAGTNIVAQIGFVKWSDGGTHNIAKAHFPIGAVTAGTGSTYRVSLQDVSTSVQGQPDGVVDQSWTTTTMPTANSWTTATFGAVRSNVASGSMLALVHGFSVFGSSTNILIRGAALSTNVQANRSSYVTKSTNSGSTWAVQNIAPIVVFESDDTTPVFGTFWGAGTWSAVNVHTFDNASNPRAYGAKIIPPTDMDATCLWAVMSSAVTTSDFNLVLRDSSFSLIESVSVDAHTLSQGGAGSTSGVHYAPLTTKRTLTAGTTYYVTLEPTSTNDVSIISIDFAAADYMDLVSGGQKAKGASKNSSDVWSDTAATNRVLAGVVYNGTSGGGTTSGIIEHGRLGGGF